ncbi:hypothetical protein RHOSPDRAFT_30239 [Rhodotorula sp. JG-1b]|nr:hypothetical protein RHOSPDRAFT_30239 [Rhodotorula sp. JG-1b]
MTASEHPAPPQALVEALRRANVPLETYADACAACDEPCDDDQDDLAYPSGFEVDLESQMLGELKPYGRQVIVSTGKSDWIREVTDDETSIPGLVKAEYDRLQKASDGRGGLLAKLGSKVFGDKGSGGDAKSDVTEDLPGVHPSSAAAPRNGSVSSRLSILSGSFISSSHHGHRESVISLPDFKVINEVEASSASVEELVKRYLDPSIGRAGSALSGELRSWPLPYHCVILLCSHRKRDKRCSIAAPLLISQFHHHLERHGLHGNVILYFPNGTSVWFGRVTPADVGVIVDRTIMQGKVIPELLRGGLGLTGKNGPHGVLDW